MWCVEDLESFKDLIIKDVVFNGNLDVSYNNLTSLKGSPKQVNGAFVCRHNELTSLEFLPEKILTQISLSHNKLKSLKGLPKKINGNFYCSNNKLNNLLYISEEIKGDCCCSNNFLSSLKNRPKKIDGYFDCSGNANLKNVKQQIIENQIEAKKYYTDEGGFTFKDIEIEFKKYKKNLKNEETKIKNIDWGFGL